MTLCNMSIEGGARAGMVAPDETTFAYIKEPSDGPEGALGPGGDSLAESPTPMPARSTMRSWNYAPRRLRRK